MRRSGQGNLRYSCIYTVPLGLENIRRDWGSVRVVERDDRIAKQVILTAETNICVRTQTIILDLPVHITCENCRKKVHSTVNGAIFGENGLYDWILWNDVDVFVPVRHYGRDAE